MQVERIIIVSVSSEKDWTGHVISGKGLLTEINENQLMLIISQTHMNSGELFRPVVHFSIKNYQYYH